MPRYRLLLLTLPLLAGCTEVVQGSASTRLTYTWGVCLAVASPGLAWLGLVAVIAAVARRAQRRALSQAVAEDDDLQPAPGKRALQACGLGCAALAGLILLGPVLPFLAYRIEAYRGGPLLIREFPTTHRFARAEVSELTLVPAPVGGSPRLRITAGARSFYVNASEVGDEGFAGIRTALERWYRETPLDAPVAPVDPSQPTPSDDAVPVEEAPEPPAPVEPPPPVRAPGPGDAELSGRRLVLQSLWGAGSLQHTAAVRGVCVLPKGALLAGDDDGLLRCWSLTDGAARWIARAHEGPVSGLAASPDGVRIVSSSRAAGTTAVRDATTGAVLHSLDRGGAVAWLTEGLLSVDGWIWDPAADRCRRPDASDWLTDAAQTLARKPQPGDPPARGFGGGRLAEGDLVTDLASGRPIQTLAGAGDNEVLAVSRDGRWVAGGGAGSTIEIYQVSAELPAAGEEPFYEPAYQMLEGRFRGLRALAFSPDGKRIAAGGSDRIVRVFEVESGKPLARWEGHGHAVTALSFGPEGERVFSAAEDGSLRRWRIGDDEGPGPAGGHEGAVLALAFAAAGQVVSAGEDGTVRVWDLESGAQRRVLREHSYAVRALAVAPGGLTAVSGGGDGRLVRWGLKTGRKAAGAKAPELRALSNLVDLGDGNVLVAIGSDRPPVWNLDGGARVTPVSIGYPVRLAALNRDRTLLALGGEQYLQLLRKQGSGWALVKQFVHPQLAGVAFTADGQALLCGFTYGFQRVDATGTPTQRMDCDAPPGALWAFSPDGQRAFAAGPNLWLLFDLEAGAELERLTPLGDRATSAAFSASGERLVVGTARGRILRYALE